MKKDDMKSIANFLFEVGILSKTPRSGFHFLGSGHQSVSEHVHRVVYVGFVLATMEKGVDVGKVMKMCLFHDLSEARVSDLNYVHQKYNDRHEDRAVADLAKTLPFGDEMLALNKEYQEKKTRESLIAKDADQLEWLISLKEEVDIGSTRAKTWLPSAVKRLKTEGAQKIAEQVLKTDSDAWWFGDKEDEWWVSRNKQ